MDRLCLLGRYLVLGVLLDQLVHCLDLINDEGWLLDCLGLLVVQSETFSDRTAY